MSNVYISKIQDDNITRVVQQILDEMVNEEHILSDLKYLIKPNLINSMPAQSGVTTDLRIVSAVIEWLLEKNINPDNIIVAEASLINTDEIFFKLGLEKITRKYGIKVINIENGNRVKVQSPIPLTMKDLSIPQEVVDCDIIFNLPKLKTHDLTMLTLSMKNFFAFYSRPERKKAHILCIHDSIIEMFGWVKQNKINYHIMDAIIALEGKHGPTNGVPVPLSVIIASDDALSLDITCCKIVDYKYSDVIHIDRAVRNNLGSVEKINIIGTPIEKIIRKFDMPLYIPAGKHQGKILDKIYNFIFRGPLKINYNKCVRCMACKDICPEKCITDTQGKLYINKEKCIKCYCCLEACEYKAVSFKIHFSLLLRILSKVRRILRF